VRRWTLLLAGAALWLFLAAIPALADGGPHVKNVNNGTGAGGLTADNCAACHRAHTAQTDRLLIQSSETALCLTCHGAGTTGATTNVVNGIQFVPAASDPLHRNAGGVILGALRGGGFASAAIGSSSAYKVVGNLGGHGYSTNSKVPVRKDSGGAIAGASVTSAHMIVPGSPLAPSFFTGTTWGNLTTTPGDNVGATGGTLECGTCHNPHGNGNYRILRGAATDLPTVSGGDFTTGTYSAVTDAALPPTDPTTGLFTDTRNYTVIQTAGGTGTLLASQVSALPSYSNLMGDYLRRTVPWTGGGSNDAPNGDALNFNAQINAWCVSCHNRYLSTGSADATNANAIFHNRHYAANATRTPVCTTCHVAHGTNAVMTPGGYSASVPYPGGATAPAGDSRLLKVDNRGICQTCHDPTATLVTGNTVGTLPSPYTP
jgi:predicted CXXCH cytochrome family protein